jgi:DNA adenine methylase
MDDIMDSAATKPWKPVNSPIKWVGGKYKARDLIVNVIPPHHCYVEVFAGAAWVLFRKPPSRVEVYNDIDQDVVNFFRIVKEQPEEFVKSFDLELVSRAEFDRLKNIAPETLDPVARAHRFYYLIMAGWGGELDYPRFQTSISDGGGGNRLVGALKTLRSRIEPIHDRLKTVLVENLDWRQLVDRYDDPRTVMYLDPPYPDNNCNYQHNMRRIEEHKELADWMRTAKSKLILTCYNKPEIRALYSDFHIMEINFAAGMISKGGERLNKELIVANFKLGKELELKCTRQGKKKLDTSASFF